MAGETTMTKTPEPRLVYDPREYEAAYVSALEMSGGYSARLDFVYFGFPFHGTLDDCTSLGKAPVGDITFEGHPVVIEVKTKGDLANSMLSGRLLWAIWHMYLLKCSGRVQGFAVLVRAVSEPLHEKAAGSYLMARRALAKWSVRFGFTVLIAEDPADVVEIAKSFMREYHEPKEVEMPPPLIKKELLDWPMSVKALCYVPGIYIELAKAICTRKSFWDICIDAHEMDEQPFCDAYSNLFHFGGKEQKRLKSIWKEFHFEELYKEPENVFYMKPKGEYQ
jgi:ERCC4-type nuclease